MTDFSKRILLEIAYDGTAYGGYQMQQNANTVQNEMQNAIQKVFGERLLITISIGSPTIDSETSIKK